MNDNRLKNFSTLPGFAFKKEDTYVISKNYYDNTNDKLINDDIYIKLLKNIMIDSKKKTKTNKLKKKNKNTRKK
jgi:hypothetical protein